jgi:hypothetical protein
MYLEEVLSYGIVTPDESEGRVYGWIPGIVTDLDTKLMRVKARIGKQESNASTDWLVPVGMGSIESLPEVNDPVGVIFMDGDPNRGAYFYFPQSTTKERPTAEPIPLGMTYVGMFNFLVTQFNQLRTDFNSFMTTYNGHTHVTSSACTAGGATGTATPTTSTGSPTAALQANKGKSSDGSVVADKSSSEVVLAKRSKVR